MVETTRSRSSPLALVLAVALPVAAWYAVAPALTAPWSAPWVRTRTAETGVPVAPALDEIAWGEHAFERHGEQAERVIDNLHVCRPQTWFCDGPTTSDTYWVYYCELNGNELCGGCLVGRMAHAFTCYPAPCNWWEGKREGCELCDMAGR